MRTTRTARAALLTAVLLAGPVLATAPASAGTPLARDVVLDTHAVTGGSAAGHNQTSYPAVVHVKGVSAAAAKAIGSAVTLKGRSLATSDEPKTSAFVSAVVAEADNTYVSVVFDSSYYTYTAAHPEDLLTTLIFDRSTGKTLGWKDFFTNPAKAAPTLRAEVRRNAKYALGPVYESEAVAGGVGDVNPSEGTDFVPRPWGIEFFFSQGEIGPEALGPASVLVPWKAVRPLLKAPLPDLGGGATAPAYSGGEAIIDSSLLKSMAAKVAASTERGLAGRKPGSYRLLDSRVVFASVDGAGDVENLYVTTLVPLATPAKPLTVLFALGGDESNPHLDIVDVERGPVGCGSVSSAFIKALRETCPR